MFKQVQKNKKSRVYFATFALFYPVSNIYEPMRLDIRKAFWLVYHNQTTLPSSDDDNDVAAVVC